MCNLKLLFNVEECRDGSGRNKEASIGDDGLKQ